MGPGLDNGEVDTPSCHAVSAHHDAGSETIDQRGTRIQILEGSPPLEEEGCPLELP